MLTSGATYSPGFVAPQALRPVRAGPTEQRRVAPEEVQGAALGDSSLKYAGIATVGAAAVLASQTRRRQRTAISGATAVCAFENELGVQAPVGFFDPLGMSKSGDVEEFRRRRESELKHGRVSMYAVMGYITPEYYKFPGYLSPSADLKFADVPNGLAAIKVVPAEGWIQWVALCGLYEFVINEPVNPAEPGNYGRGQLGITGESISDPEKRKRSLNSELANGRLAMMAIMGMIFQNGFIGTTGPAMWIPGAGGAPAPAARGVGASPTALRAQPKVLEGTGGPLPSDMWDPAGLAKGKTDEQLLRYREVEIKHGRVCMLAVLGWFHVSAGWHFIGDAACHYRVSDDPLINATQLPIGGAFQVIFTILCAEWVFSYVIKPPAEKPWDLFGWTPMIVDEEYPDWKKAQLQELNNGRLAMVAFIGLVAQDLFTGQNIHPGQIAFDTTNWRGPFPPSPYLHGDGHAGWWEFPDLYPHVPIMYYQGWHP